MYSEWLGAAGAVGHPLERANKERREKPSMIRPIDGFWRRSIAIPTLQKRGAKRAKVVEGHRQTTLNFHVKVATCVGAFFSNPRKQTIDV